MSRIWQWLAHRWPPGIRAQLTLGYVVMFGLFLLILTPIALIGITQAFTGRIDSDLGARAERLAKTITHVNHTVVIQDPSHRLPGIGAGTLIMTDGTHGAPQVVQAANADASGDYGTLVRIVDRNAQVIYSSPAFDALSQDAANAGARRTLADGTGKASDDLRGGNDTGVRLFSVALVDDTDHTFAVLQIGQAIGPLSQIQRNLQIAFVISLPVLFLLGMGGSYALATRAFRPVRRLTQTANQIKAGDLRQRVPVPAAHDDLRNLAVTFNAMIAQLEQSFTQQRRFVADASHELRTPVTVIRSMTDVVLAHEGDAAEYAATLREVNAEAERLGKLINTLLALARIDEGRADLEHEPVRLDQLAADTVASAQPLAEERDLTLETGTLDAATVTGDTARLIQVIMSLVDNALLYTPAGGRVTVSVTTTEDSALLTVSDTGIGIGEDDLPHIFERFYRADPARSRVMGGSGLGLTLVEEIARAHAGAVTVTSAPGIGSTFTVRLPLA